MPKLKEKIGIIGLGYVGSVLQTWFQRQKNNYELFLYDKFKKIGSPDEIDKADTIFIAVPTPFHEKSGYDDSAVRDAISKIKNDKTVIIKSTILPGSTNSFQKKYPKKTILFNPEFLREKTALRDFLHPNKQLVGYASSQGKRIAPKILTLLPKAPYSKIIPAVDAEIAKYFNNTYLAVRVTFANQIYDLCAKLGANYDAVKDCVVQDKRIGYSHFDVFHDGYRGFGGSCLPKDLNSLLQLAHSKKVDLSLLRMVNKINTKLTKQKEKIN